MKINVNALKEQIKMNGYTWEAEENHMTEKDAAERIKMLGAIEPLESKYPASRVYNKTASLTLVSQIDWRNNIGNYVTDVKDQGGCGSCVGFGSTAVVESMAAIENGIASLRNLSVADAFFCSAHGASCQGWWPSSYFYDNQGRGIIPDTMFPYPSAFPGPICVNVPNRSEYATLYTNINSTNTVDTAKDYLVNVGPITACFAVYQDFYGYSSGIYKQTSTVYEGLHCICIVGFNDNNGDGYWICKNSWGTGWGMDGYFYIAYNQCQIDSFEKFGISGVSIPDSLKPTIADTMGAITIDGGRPYVFLNGNDGNLWVNWWSGTNWNWSNQGTPSGVPILKTMGAVTVDGGRPYVFVQGNDGNLWVNWWDGNAWYWSNQGIPSGVTIVETIGAITVDGGRPYVFVKGSDGNLWVNWWDGNAWYWSNQDTPSGVAIVETMGAITVDGGRPYVFVTGDDGNLWVNWWDGNAWYWSNQGLPSGVSIVETMGAITVDGGRPYVFVTGNDGNLWVNWWDGNAWYWSNQNTPSSVAIAGSMGAITVDGGRPYVFMTGNDGNLWVNWWSGTNWNWANQGIPSGVTIVETLGTITVDGGRPYVFVKGNDGNLWVNWWSGTNWYWSKL